MYSCRLKSNPIVFGAGIIFLINYMVAARAPTSADKIHNYRLRRSFYDYDCKGIYDKMIFAKVVDVCEQCFNQMREQEVHSLCRSNCFSSDYFKGCLELLKLNDEVKQYEGYIIKLKGLGVK